MGRSIHSNEKRWDINVKTTNWIFTPDAQRRLGKEVNDPQLRHVTNNHEEGKESVTLKLAVLGTAVETMFKRLTWATD